MLPGGFEDELDRLLDVPLRELLPEEPLLLPELLLVVEEELRLLFVLREDELPLLVEPLLLVFPPFLLLLPLPEIELPLLLPELLLLLDDFAIFLCIDLIGI